MTWNGSPVVYKKSDIIVIAPRIKEEILAGLKFDKVFEFCGAWNDIRITDKKTMKFDDVFGDTRMARLLRISMDLDGVYEAYIEKRKQDKIERSKMLRKAKITAKKGLIIKIEDRDHLSCPEDKCGRRFHWYNNTPLEGQCPRYDCRIKIKDMEDGTYKITKLGA